MTTPSSNSESKFIPKPGQIDFTNVRYCPVINCVLQYQDKILIVERNATMRLYPGYWNGISGFLDDDRSVEEKVRDELGEEVGMAAEHIVSIHVGQIFSQEEEKYKKTWIVHPVLVMVNSDRIVLDWEAQKYRWIKVEEARNFQLLPGFEKVLAILFPNKI